MTTHKTSFSFRLRSCIEARLLLARYPGNNATASELSIGAENNQKTKFLPDRQHPAEQEVVTETPNILSCDTFRDFWISIDGKYFQFGKGTAISANVILEYTFSSIQTVNALAFSSYPIGTVPPGQKYGGEWSFAQSEGNYICSYMHASKKRTQQFVKFMNETYIFMTDLLHSDVNEIILCLTRSKLDAIHT